MCLTKMQRIIFFDPLPVKNQPNMLVILDEKYIGKLILMFEDNDPILLKKKQFDIAPIYNKIDKQIVSFTVSFTQPQNKALERKYVLFKTDCACACLYERIYALEALLKITRDPNMISLLAEFYIYHSQNITNFDDFLSSKNRLRDDELECLTNKLKETNGANWLFEFCKRFRENSALEKQASINWLWMDGMRLFHFVTGPQAEKILENGVVGAFILRPSFTNPGHLAGTYIDDETISQGIFEDPSIVKKMIAEDTNLLFGVIAASDNKYDTDSIISIRKENMLDIKDKPFLISKYIQYKAPLQEPDYEEYTYRNGSVNLCFRYYADK